MGGLPLRVTVTYCPVLELGSGLVVGAVVPELTRPVAQAFAFGSAAHEGWWIAGGLQTAPVAPPAVEALLASSGVPASRVVLAVTYAELAHAVRSGAASALGALGVRFTVTGFSAERGAAAVLRAAPVASLQISLAGLGRSDPDHAALVRSVVRLARTCGTTVLARDVDSDQQLALAGEAGVALAAGYWWGSPGSLAKLVGTWARLPVSG